MLLKLKKRKEDEAKDNPGILINQPFLEYVNKT